MDRMQINIFVTEECNRMCEGCYYPHSQTKMTPEATESVAIWVNNLIEKEGVKNLDLRFLGGETLLNLESVLKITDYVIEHKPESMSFSSLLLFTNGDPLFEDKNKGEDILRELKKRTIKVLLNPTYDSLERVEQKVKFIKLICGGCSLAVVLDELNMDRLLDLVEIALSNDAHIRIARLYQGPSTPGYVERYTEQVPKALDKILEADRPMSPDFIIDSICPSWKGVKNPYLCGKRFVVIDPDGTCRSCSGDMTSIIGSIQTCSKLSDFKFPYRHSAKNISECQSCKWVTWCQGGCPFVSKLTYGRHTKSPMCSALKILFPKLMKITERWENRKEN